MAKPWGQRMLPPPFAGLGSGEAVGEIWYSGVGGAPADLLVKYLFTSERLSIQVHPDDDGARRLGLSGGKDEAWLVLAAEPDATIGLGLVRPCSADEVRAAALDGSIEMLLDWRPAAAGDVFYLPAGTVHALGPGLVVAEIQQNADVTFRLYDYGRPRELHLDEAMAVARLGPWTPPALPRRIGDGREVLVEGGRFVIERWTGGTGLPVGDACWLVPLAGACSIAGEELSAGEVALVQGSGRIDLDDGSTLLVAYAGGAVREAA